MIQINEHVHSRHRLSVLNTLILYGDGLPYQNLLLKKRVNFNTNTCCTCMKYYTCITMVIQFCTILKYVLFDKSKHYFVNNWKLTFQCKQVKLNAKKKSHFLDIRKTTHCS